ncbi:TPM domain-containing protein [Streptomyces sp. NPDC048416]|uniref:TPM domain-containing protein n=1 Tax=Streptomyces sp. NPDC048416 TaxID=3365546 RepID=UPI0037165CE7
MTPPAKRARHRAAAQGLAVSAALCWTLLTGPAAHAAHAGHPGHAAHLGHPGHPGPAAHLGHPGPAAHAGQLGTTPRRTTPRTSPAQDSARPALANGTHGGGSSSSDLVLPIGLVVVAGAAAAYAYGKRKWRTASRTTPGGSAVHNRSVPPAPVEFDVLDGEVRAALVGADEAVRTREQELARAQERCGPEAVRPLADALARARSELATAFRLRQELDEGRPPNEAARRHVLAEMAARCDGAGRHLDAEAEAFDRLRAHELSPARALAPTEAAFRELTTRTGAAEASLGALRREYASSASAPFAGHIEDAKDRLVFATTSLNGARQALDAGDDEAAAARVRDAEDAVGQADVLVASVERRGRELADAAQQLSASLTACEADLADARRQLEGLSEPPAGLPERISRAESVLAGVREESTAGPYDPVAGLRRILNADADADAAPAAGAHEGEDAVLRAPALLDAADLTARASIAAADDHIATHRGVAGSGSRTRLAAARTRLEQAPPRATDAPGALSAARAADALAREALDLAEQDVAAYAQQGSAGRAGNGAPGATANSEAADGNPVAQPRGRAETDAPSTSTPHADAQGGNPGAAPNPKAPDAAPHPEPPDATPDSPPDVKDLNDGPASRPGRADGGGL